jgi:hypothetical protein
MLNKTTKQGWLLRENYKLSMIFAALIRMSGKKKNHPLKVDDLIISKSLIFLDAQINVLDTHVEKELYFSELKKDQSSHNGRMHSLLTEYKYILCEMGFPFVG